MMSFRLGEFQCSSCDYSEVPAPTKPESARGESISRRQPWQPTVGSNLPSSGRQYTGAPQPWQATPRQAAPPSAYGGADEPPAPWPAQSGGFAAPSWEALPYSGEPVEVLERSSALDGEKHLCFGLYILCVAFCVGCVIYLMNMFNQFAPGSELYEAYGQTATGSSGGAGASLSHAETLRAFTGSALVFVIVAGLAGLFLMWWAFYGSAIWARWCCIGCLALGILVALVNSIECISAWRLLARGHLPLTGLMWTVMLFFPALLAYQIWAATILYRDAQELRNR